MKRTLSFLMVAGLLLLASCELYLDEPRQGDVYHINVALDYENNSSAKDNLGGTLNDAEELHLALGSVTAGAQRAGTGYRMIQKGSGYAGDHIYSVNSTLISNYPTKSNIHSLLTNLSAVVQEDDLTIFTYSGHGVEESGHLVLAKPVSTVDAETLDPTTLLSWMAAIPGKKLIILDSCYSGMFVDGSPSSTSTVLDNSIQKFFETYHSSDRYEKPDLFVLSASAHADSYEMNYGTEANEHKHGVFTYALLQALGWKHTSKTDPSLVQIFSPPAAKWGRITVDDLFKYITKNQVLPTRLRLFGSWSEYQHPLTTGGPLDLALFNL
ncbi:MAG: caspase family protein [Sphaerochaeta sp.]|nr:caspase family protein [Sphaerochaeta sp.]